MTFLLPPGIKGLIKIPGLKLTLVWDKRVRKEVFGLGIYDNCYKVAYLETIHVAILNEVNTKMKV